MQVDIRQDILDQLKLLLSHGLDNESLIVTEKKEWTWGSWRLTWTEDLVSVFVWV